MIAWSAPNSSLTRYKGLSPVSVKRAAVQAGDRQAATRRTRPGNRRAESFPPAVAALIDARDPWCVLCGVMQDLQRHHRRIRGIGGDSRPHTNCACNGVRLCATCHVPWVHTRGRREAEAEGLIIPRSTVLPALLPVLVRTADGGMKLYPTCDGLWVAERPEGAEAA